MALDRLPQLDDDGLHLPEVGSWGETKYRLIENYASMFSIAMRGKWEARVFVDLFAGAGRARVAGTSVIIPTSATLALGVKHPFDKYVLCDIDETAMYALEQRVRRDFPGRDVIFVLGDCNAKVDAILEAIPTARRDFRVLTFCVVDPYSLRSLKFSTIRAIAERYVDFLVLIPSFMDAHRNPRHYTKRDHPRIDEFLGSREWRSAWDAADSTGRPQFGAFLVEQFKLAMAGLGFHSDGPGDAEPIRDSRNHLLYHLAFFSRHPRGREFWTKARRSSIDQLRLFGSD